MNPSDENPLFDPESTGAPEQNSTPPMEVVAPQLAGDPLSFAAAATEHSEVARPGPLFPADLQITWSWAHFVIFILFGFISLILVQGVLALHYAPNEKLTPSQLEQYLIAKPQFVIGSMVIWYGLIFFFLYVTLSVLRGHSFWVVLGWRKIRPFTAGRRPRGPAFFMLSGALLSFVVALVGSRMKAPDNAPVEQLFRHRETALLFIAMAVLIAPLVEETLFRGYLYPLFARSFGVWPAIILTGVLFGFMHGAQLGWTWNLVAVLILVGIIFTFVRARTGSVLASFLMHLGYNSLISLVALIETQGFTKLPPGH